MTMTITARGSGTTGTGTIQTLASSSFTPTAGAKLYAVGVAQNEGSSDAQSWSCSGGSLTWEQIAVTTQRQYAGITGYDSTSVMFEATVGGSPGSMTVTVDPHSDADFAYMSLHVFEVTGTDVELVQFAAASDTKGSGGGVNDATHTVTLPGTATSGNLCIATLGGPCATGGPTTPSGWTALTSSTQEYTQVNVFHRSDLSGDSITWTDCGQGIGAVHGIMIELEEAAPPPPAGPGLYIGELPVVAMYVGDASA